MKPFLLFCSICLILVGLGTLATAPASVDLALPDDASLCAGCSTGNCPAVLPTYQTEKAPAACDEGVCEKPKHRVLKAAVAPVKAVARVVEGRPKVARKVLGKVFRRR